ncbi:unnamed protein product [Diatraea saccharalis]|uniref:p53 DNA-binding domain-containing protein n=1 Tax=Diatraea saccharalis TaxID=40085 RepID=A0A9N9WEJ1_9NEOP|nr:unnamed protein product [Diatraea saccharalis]
MSSQAQFSFPDFPFQELDTIQIMTGDMNSPNLDDDVTLESHMQFNYIPPDVPDIPLQPALIIGPPVRTPIQNNHNFKVEINSADVNRKKYLYSSQLNKIYVDINCNFAVQFSWEGIIAKPLYVRATVVFSDEDQAEKRVERCIQHRHESITDDSIRMNVLRSSREVGTQGVFYHGDPSRADSWYSVLVEMNNTGQSTIHAYKFVCKNSCSSGINRRAIAIIFTLEDAFGNVYGREMTGARVCSCPRRDLLKDEESEGVFKSGKKRVPANQINKSKTKKIKIEVVPNGQAAFDTNLITLPQLQVVGANVMTAGLEMMVRMMEQGIAARSDDSQYVANCSACVTSLKAAIQQYKHADSQ